MVTIWSPDTRKCIECLHEFGEHFEVCKFHRKNIAVTRLHADKAFIITVQVTVSKADGTGIDLDASHSRKFAFAYTGNVTDKKRLAWGEYAFIHAYPGRVDDGQEVWNNAPEDQRLRWVQSRGGRYEDVTVEITEVYDDFSINHTRGSMGCRVEHGYYNDDFERVI